MLINIKNLEVKYHIKDFSSKCFLITEYASFINKRDNSTF
ncbi:hypothetical protein MYM_0164 [Mesomycoplasma hyorhinis GDL-1]|uniref:ABC transporter ATP-binding protein n=2 Tax=Mesomycoplasma hyorhinis TaxID=2100 RepID=A0ABM5M5V2_MESHM|nr:hypothetical protein SRH_01235 [Mesomycoplasma hyorhinis MCLD]AEX13960.1 hypothetical protein MYM_0164 [Mesomycoplasma hyorhinis GDL-1]